MPARMKVKTGEEMYQRINEYFEVCLKSGQPTSVSGLALFTGLHDRDGVKRYIDRGGRGCRDEECGEVRCENCMKSDALKEAKARIIETWLPFLQKTTPTGAIYYLKTMGLWDTPAALAILSGKEGEQVSNVTISFNNAGEDKPQNGASEKGV